MSFWSWKKEEQKRKKKKKKKRKEKKKKKITGIELLNLSMGIRNYEYLYRNYRYMV